MSKDGKCQCLTHTTALLYYRALKGKLAKGAGQTPVAFSLNAPQSKPSLRHLKPLSVQQTPHILKLKMAVQSGSPFPPHWALHHWTHQTPPGS